MAEFSPEIALKYAVDLSRPRFVGTPAEAATAAALTETLTRFGYAVRAEPFSFSTAVNVAVIGQVAVCLGLVALTLAARGLHPAAPALPAGLLLLGLAAFNPVLRSAEAGALIRPPGEAQSAWIRLGRRFTTRNLVAELPGQPPDPARPHLILMAHYDSKRQRLPILVRLGLIVTALGGSLACAGLALLAVAWPPAAEAALAAGVIALAAGLPLLGLDWLDGSPGAIDNASGVGLVLHLAECLARRPGLSAALRWTILLTSAEELALMGAAAFAERHGPALREAAEAGGLAVLNFDGVGVDGALYYDDREGAEANPLTRRVLQAAQAAGQPLRRFGLPGVLFDHIPFARRGLPAVTVLAVGPATWAVHTPADTADKLHARGFAQAGAVALRVVEALAQGRTWPSSSI